MRNKISTLLTLTLVFIAISVNASTVLNANWSDVARGKCSDQSSAWWGSAEAIRIAENVLLYQKDIGGWPKNTNMQVVLTQTEKNTLIAQQPGNSGCTIDNGAVSYELTYLSRVYGSITDATVKAKIATSFIKGIQYLISAQYTSGGWPQFYPLKGGYADHITYNDDAIVHVLEILRHAYNKDNTYTIKVDDAMAAKAKIAFDKGIECILKTQYLQNGIPTVWCAQHNYLTFLPVLARAYELPSLSGAESAGILKLLMSLDKPSNEIIRAVYGGATWYDENRIKGQRLESFTNSDGLSDKRIVLDPSAPDMWARFSRLEDSKPFFCDRDGIMVYSIAEIGHERRNGYSWYGNAGFSVISTFNSWVSKWGKTILLAPVTNAQVAKAEGLSVKGIANKKSGKIFQRFDLIVDTNTVYSYTTQTIDTTLLNLDYGTHKIVIKAIYSNNYSESDSNLVTINRPSHTLNMFYGTGGGTFPEGTVITVKADKPAAGKTFYKWLGDVDFVGSITDSVTTFTIPNKNSKLRASYKIATGIDDILLNKTSICYPNPVISDLNINLSTIGDATIELFNMMGTKLFSVDKVEGIHSLNLNHLPTGNYIIKVLKGNSTCYSTTVIKL